MKNTYCFNIPKMKTRMLIDDIEEKIYLKAERSDHTINAFWIIPFDNVEKILLDKLGINIFLKDFKHFYV